MLGIFILLFGLTRLITVAVQRLAPAALVLNTAVLFGLFTRPVIVLAAMALGVAAVVRILRSAGRGPLDRWGLGLIIVGGLSNILDRAIYGGVIDYLPLFHWSTFNLADVEILVGVTLLVVPFGHQKAPSTA